MTAEDVMAMGIFKARFGAPGISDAAEADARAAVKALAESGYVIVKKTQPGYDHKGMAIHDQHGPPASSGDEGEAVARAVNA
jgi:hypothetical protein